MSVFVIVDDQICCYWSKQQGVYHRLHGESPSALGKMLYATQRSSRMLPSTAQHGNLGSQKIGSCAHFPHLCLERCSRETAWRCPPSLDLFCLCLKGRFTALSWMSQAACRGKQAEWRWWCRFGYLLQTAFGSSVVEPSVMLPALKVASSTLRRLALQPHPLTMGAVVSGPVRSSICRAGCATPVGTCFLFSGHPPTVVPLMAAVISRKVFFFFGISIASPSLYCAVCVQ